MTGRVLRVWIVWVAVAVSGLPAFVRVLAAQEPQIPAATADASAAPSAQAKAAVDLVTRLFTVNPTASINGSGKPLDKDGSWGVRAALPDERPAVCEEPGATCTEVVYHAGTAQIVCAWTVLFPAKGTPKVVRDNEASASYMMVQGTSVVTKQKSKANDNRDFLGDTGPKLLNHVDVPDYSEIKGANPMSGLVRFNVIVNATGAIAGVSLKSGLDAAHDLVALRTIKQYKFTPMLLDSRPQTCELLVDINWYRTY